MCTEIPLPGQLYSTMEAANTWVFAVVLALLSVWYGVVGPLAMVLVISYTVTWLVYFASNRIMWVPLHVFATARSQHCVCVHSGSRVAKHAAVLVTGSSSGIGRATVVQLVDSGWCTVGVAQSAVQVFTVYWGLQASSYSPVYANQLTERCEGGWCLAMGRMKGLHMMSGVGVKLLQSLKRQASQAELVHPVLIDVTDEGWDVRTHA